MIALDLVGALADLLCLALAASVPGTILVAAFDAATGAPPLWPLLLGAAPPLVGGSGPDGSAGPPAPPPPPPDDEDDEDDEDEEDEECEE